ncbi:MAG TPA: DUF1615 domain-containing protein [Caldimonas sp.]|nr:DUF1615 domain-containing protein [Caldimonas sp.]
MHVAVRALASWTLAAAVLAGCGSPPTRAPERPEDVRARIASLLPANVVDRPGWALDITAAFTALGIAPTNEHACAVLAVVEQESTYRADPAVPGLGRIARDEIDRRADRAGVPKLLVDAALGLRSPDSRTWAERIDAARTEKELSDVFEDFIAQVPLGHRLLAGFNPVRTGGPMQVGIAFAEKQVQARPYPYRMTGSLRDEVFSRRGGLYFGIAHLLDYPLSIDQPIFRFADFNAGRYASRNAAFQQAVSVASARPLDFDGDLVPADGSVGRTETAVRTLAPRLAIDDAAIRRALELEDRPDLEKTRLYTRVFELAEQTGRRPLPRAIVPQIELHSPKITRPLTTEWFARRVDERYARCLARAAAANR